jgi:hypothetical protein
MLCLYYRWWEIQTLQQEIYFRYSSFECYEEILKLLIIYSRQKKSYHPKIEREKFKYIKLFIDKIKKCLINL